MDLLYFVLFVSILIFIHEFGHFAFAKLFGVKVLTFSIGFGPKVLKVRGKETEYCIGLLPFGGFVKMLEEGKVREAILPEERHRTFESQALWKRVVIVNREHPLAQHAGPLSLEELASSPLITYEASRHADSSFCRVMAQAGLSPQFSLSAQDGDTLKAYTRAGLGVGLVAELALGSSDHAHFVVLQVEERLPDCTLWAVLPRGRVLRYPTIDLLRLLAPQLDPEALRRASQGMPPEHWPEPPTLRFG